MPARRRRTRPASRGAPGCLRFWSAALRGSPPARRSPRRPASWPWHSRAACQESDPPAAARRASCVRWAGGCSRSIRPAPATRPSISGSCGALPPRLRLRSSRWPAAETRSLVSRSSMASRTTGQCARVLNLVFLHQPASDLFLFAGRLVAHGRDELAWPHVLFGMAVTIQAPLHLERVLLPGERHPVHPPVAGELAPDGVVPG